MPEKGKPTPKEVEAMIQIAQQNNVHIDVAVNPFIEEGDRIPILEGKEQDPEWD